MGRRFAAALLAAWVLVGCGDGAVLDDIRAEPILDAPPGAELVAETERSGSSTGFGTSSGRAVLWHYDGSPDEAIEYYRTSFVDFDLQRHPSDLNLSGSRGSLGQDYVPSATVEVFASVDDIPWDRVVLEPDDIESEPPDDATLVLVEVVAS